MDTKKDYTENDIDILKYQLKSKKIYLDKVITRCKYGYPRIIFLNPLVQENNKKNLNYQFLSNLIWLTCPFLNDKIHDLESMGYIQKISDYIDSKRRLRKMMTDAHVQYYYLKKRIYNGILGNWDYSDIIRLKFDTGIGGIRDISKIKCLHLHYAHYHICKENFAGRFVSYLLDKNINCKQVNCKNARQKD